MLPAPRLAKRAAGPAAPPAQAAPPARNNAKPQRNPKKAKVQFAGVRMLRDPVPVMLSPPGSAGCLFAGVE